MIRLHRHNIGRLIRRPRLKVGRVILIFTYHSIRIVTGLGIAKIITCKIS